MKRWLIVGGVVVGIIVLAVLLAPLFINVDSFRPELETKLSATLGRTVHVGKLSASILSGGARADNISISDDPAFSKGPFLQASSVQVGLEWLPLIFSHQIKATSITVDKPEVVLLRNSAGKWNYSSLGTHTSGAKNKPDPPKEGAGPDLSIQKFEIVNGKIRAGQIAGRSASHERVYQNVRLLVRDISDTTAMPFTLLADTPGGGSLDLEGKAGPLDQKDLAKTPLDAKITLEHADIGATGFFDPNSGLAGIVDFDGKITSDGKKLHSEGKAKANNMKLVRGGGPSRQPVALDYTSDYALDSETGAISSNVHTGSSTANLSGSLNGRGESIVANLKLLGKNMAVNDVEGLLPAFGVVLPSGASLRGGTINTELTAQGPLDRLVITGPVNVSGAHLSGYDLTSKLGAMAALAGVRPSSDTLIQTFNAAMRVAPEGIRADNIFLDVPSIGQLMGNGVISPNNALNFKMALKLASGATSLTGGLAALTGPGNGIPFLIEGTTANPVFRPAVCSVLKNTLNPANPKGLGDALGGLFGGKKKSK